jgi:hypothetical protein
MYIYHVTRPHWLANGMQRIGFRHYVKPSPDEPFRDHAPLNHELQINPGKQVYATFFFDNENTASITCFELLTWQPHVLLRVDSNHQCFEDFSKAPDDRDLTEGAHMWYRADAVMPLKAGDSMLHPIWGIPFDGIHIRSEAGGNWEPLNVWLSRVATPVANMHGHPEVRFKKIKQFFSWRKNV